MKEKIRFKLGKQIGCLFDDTIFIPMSPSNVRCCLELFKAEALNADTYGSQGIARRLKDLFQDAIELWRLEREKK